MLTVFHTADWHLGQSFCGFDRDFEHAKFLEWLTEQLRTRRPDVLLLAGDVFDSVNPSAQAQQRFYSFLADAHSTLPTLQIVITAGNHDASARLEAPAGLLDSLNIAVIGTVQRDQDGHIDVSKFLVPVQNSAGETEAIVMAVPFLRPSDVPVLPNPGDPYLDGIRELYRQVTEAALELQTAQYPNAALIAMGHCHLAGAAESPDSERRLIVGGAEAVPVDGFDPRIAYVALGHLHRAQPFDNGRIRYSGSPIPLSFSETHYRHQILQLTVDRQERTSVDSIPIPRTTSLMKVPTSGSLPIDGLLRHLQSLELDPELPPEQHPFLEIRVRDDGPDPTRRTRIEKMLEGRPVRLASIKSDRGLQPDGGDNSAEHLDVESLRDIQPLDVFTDAWREKYNTEPESDVLDALREILLQESDST